MDIPKNTESSTENILKKINKFKDYSWQQYKKYKSLNTLLVLAGVSLSFSTSLAAFLDYSKLAGCLSLLIGSFVIIQSHFKFSQRANAWRKSHAESKNIRDFLETRVSTDDDFEKAFNWWVELKRTLDSELPNESGYEISGGDSA